MPESVDVIYFGLNVYKQIDGLDDRRTTRYIRGPRSAGIFRDNLAGYGKGNGFLFGFYG
jgi:hypothetical protein